MRERFPEEYARDSLIQMSQNFWITLIKMLRHLFEPFVPLTCPPLVPPGQVQPRKSLSERSRGISQDPPGLTSSRDSLFSLPGEFSLPAQAGSLWQVGVLQRGGGRHRQSTAGLCDVLLLIPTPCLKGSAVTPRRHKILPVSIFPGNFIVVGDRRRTVGIG